MTRLGVAWGILLFGTVTALAGTAESQSRCWQQVLSHAGYQDASLTLVSATSHDQRSQCPPAWGPDIGTFYHSRIVYRIEADGRRTLMEACVSDQCSLSLRPLADQKP